MSEQLLFNIVDPTEREMAERLMARPLKDKIEHSINLIKCWAESSVLRDPENGYQFGFSGGKDSIVVKQLLIDAGVKFKSTYNCTTIDPPELIRYIRKHHPEVEWNRQEERGHLILDRMVEKMSMPTRLGKWCCSEYKDCCSKSNTIGVVGVRIAESARRANLWKEFTKHSKTGRWILAPICYWTDEDVWNFIRERELPYCELYDQGWSRLGCVGCPINPKSQKKEFERWPKYEKMWKEGCRRIWEKTQENPLNSRGEKRYWTRFETPEDMWNWWLTGEHTKKEADCMFEEMMENT